MKFQKGNTFGGRTKGARNRETIKREERRAIFEAEMSQLFINKIHEAKPEYLLDQFLGKAADKVEFKQEGHIEDSALIEAAKAYGVAIVKRKTS